MWKSSWGHSEEINKVENGTANKRWLSRSYKLYLLYLIISPLLIMALELDLFVTVFVNKKVLQKGVKKVSTFNTQ